MRVMLNSMAVGMRDGARLGSAPPHPCVKRIESDPVDQFGGPLDVPDREVAGFAGFQASDFVDSPSAARRIACYRGKAFVDGEAEQVAPMFIVSSSEVSGEVPGLLSVASAIGTPCRRIASTGGIWFRG